MSHNRFFSSLLALTILAAAAALTLRSAASGTVAKDANDEGMDLYQASERGASADDGMALYHASERGVASDPGLDRFASHWWKGNKGEVDSPAGAEPAMTSAGLSIYQSSERNQVDTSAVRAAGLKLFQASEWSMAPQRLFEGKPFNAYQRSEWLGADR